MAVATEVSIPAFASNLVGSSAVFGQAANSQGTIDTTPTQTLQGLYTGSWPGNVNTWDTLEISGTQGLYTGSWPGNVNNWDLIDVSVSGTNLGSWPGNVNNWDLYQVPYDDHRKDVITNNGEDVINATQGGVTVEWNFFPFPPAEPEPPQKARDLTRFQKAYSFTRQQPVRIRLYRK